MKQEEINRLREKLGDEFELVTQSPDDNDKFFVVIAKKKDPWDGVEFVECISSGIFYNLGEIYSVSGFQDKFGERFVTTEIDGKGCSDNGLNIKFAKPSTETAYIDQLKKEAFERFGEIKDGDRFQAATGGEYTVSEFEQREWDYFKKHEQLFYRNVEIYCSGKWAKKLPERVKVELDYESFGGDPTYYFKTNAEIHKLEGSGEYLAKCLEDYLNKEAGL